MSLGLAAAVGITDAQATSNGNTQTTVEGGLESAGAIQIDARAINHATAHGEAASVAGGGGAAGASASATTNPKVEAILKANDFAIANGAINVKALADNKALATADGGAIGLGVGIGVIHTNATTNGQTTALLGSETQGTSVNVKTTANNTATAQGISAGGGFLGGGSGVTADVHSAPKSISKVTGKVRANTVNIETNSTNTPTASANTIALSAGASDGGAEATVTSKPISHASIEGGSVSALTALTLDAHDTSIVTSNAGSASVGGAAHGSGIVTNIVAADVNAGILHGLHDTNKLTINAIEVSTVNGKADGLVAGGLSLAGGVVTNDVQNSTTARILSDVFVNLNSPGTGDVVVNAKDVSHVTSTVDLASVGLGASGSGMTFSKVANQVHSNIGELAFVATNGNVIVTANEDTSIKDTAVGVSVGAAAGVAGNVAINTIANDIEASIYDKAKISAGNNVLVQAEMNNKLSSSARSLAGGFIGQGGTVMVNTFDNSTRAFIDKDSTVLANGSGPSLTINKWDSAGNQTVEKLDGLAVIASSVEEPGGIDPDGNGPKPRRTMDAYNLSGGFAGLASINTVNVMNDRTEAFIAGSKINSNDKVGDDVIVRAHSDQLLHSHADGVAGGLAGVGGVSSRNTITGYTRAFISDNDESGKDLFSQQSSVFGKYVEVSTASRETIEMDVLGVTGGAVSLAGGISVAEIKSVNQAFIRDSQVTSGGDLAILANDITKISSVVSTDAVGVFAGGAAIGFNTIENVVQAQVLGGQLFASNDMDIKANSQESITTVSHALGAGLASLAGTVTINTIENTTEATVGNGDQFSQLNVVSPVSTGQPPLQYVTIAANDKAAITNDQGSQAGSFAAAAGAAVEFANIRNRTVAEVGPESLVNATKDVTIDAQSDRKLDSELVAFGGGLVGLSGAVSVLTLGAPDADDIGAIMSEFLKKDDKGNSLQSQTNSSASTPDISTAISDKPGSPSSAIAKGAAAQVNFLGDATVDGAINAASGERITAARVNDASSVAKKAKIDADGKVVIKANNEYQVTQKVGSVSVGALAVGASIASTAVHNTTKAELGNFNIIDAGGNVSITSEDTNSLATPIDISSTAGSGGVIAIDFNLAKFDLDSDTTARVGKNAKVERGQAVLVEAQQTSHLEAEGTGFGFALAAAAGSVKVLPTIHANTNAVVDDSATIGVQRRVKSLTTQASSNNSVDTSVKVGKAAIGGGISSGVSTIELDPVVSAHIGSASVNVLEETVVKASATNNATSNIKAFAAGIVGDGAGTSDVTFNGSVTSDIGANALVKSGSLAMSTDQKSTIDAKGVAIGGGLVAGIAAGASALVDMDSIVKVGDASIILDKSADIQANSTSNATATSGSIGVVGFGKGGSISKSKILGSVNASLLPGAVLESGGSVHVLAGTTNAAIATSQATSGGIVNGSAAETVAKTDVDSLASVESAEVIADDEIRVESKATNSADADSIGATASLLAAKGHVESTALVEGSTRALANGTIHSGNSFIRVQALDENSHVKSTTKAAGAGIGASLLKNTAIASISPSIDDGSPQVQARLAGDISAASDIAVRAKSIDAAATTNAKGVSLAAGVASGGTDAQSTLAQTVRAAIGNGSTVDGAQDVKVEAINHPALSDAKASSTGGALAVGISGASAKAIALGSSTSVIGDANVSAAKVLQVIADTDNQAKATGDGIAIGLIAGVGDVRADAIAGDVNTSTVASINDGATLTARDLFLKALDMGHGISFAVGAGGGAFSDQGAVANTEVTNGVSAKIGENVAVTLTGDATILSEAVYEGDAEAEGNSFGLVGAVSDSKANVKLTPKVNTLIAKNSHLDVGGNINAQAVSNQNAPTDFAPSFQPKPDGSKGAASVVANDGYSQARAIGAAGSAFVGIQGTSAKVTTSPQVFVTVAATDEVQPPTLKADGNITLMTTSRVNVDAQSANDAVGILGAGSGNALSGTDTFNTSEVVLQPSARIIAGNDVSIAANARNVGNADANATGFGAIGLANADSFTDIDYLARARIETGAKIVAGNAIAISSTSNNLGDADVSADGGGIGALTSANDRAEDDNFSDEDDLKVGTSRRGVRIGHLLGKAQTEIGQSAELTAETVSLKANIARTEGQSTALANAAGAGVDSDSLSRVELWDDADVTIRHNAKITGHDTVLVQATVSDLNIGVFAKSTSAGLFAGATATVIADSDNDATVNAESDALITTHDLQVKALVNDVDYPSLDPNNANEKGSLDSGRSINFDSDAVLSSGPAILIIGAGGVPIEQQNIDFHISGNTLFVHDIANNDPGTVLFQTNSIAGAPQGIVRSLDVSTAQLTGQPLVHGVGPLFTFVETLDNVQIENRSNLNLQIGNIGVVNKLESPEVTIDTQTISQPSPILSKEVFGFDVKHTFDGTHIDISDPIAASPNLILINGQIDNPIGSTEIKNTGGAVTRSLFSPNSMIRSNDIFIESAGNVGVVGRPIRVQLVQAKGLPADLDVLATGDVQLDVQGLIREKGKTQFDLYDGNVVGNNVNMTLRDALVQTTVDPNVSYLVDVTETHPIQTTPVENRFRPAQPGLASLTTLDLGVFGVGSTKADASYEFDKVQAAGNINIVGQSSGKKVNLDADTNLLGNGKIDVNTNGNIDLAETVGDLRVGLITSTGGNVILASNGANIVDADNEAAADAVGNNVTILAPLGSIGTPANPLDINSSAISTSEVNGHALNNIDVVETAGNLNTGIIKAANGNATLATLNGSIVDAHNDAPVNVSGKNISLTAKGAPSVRVGEVGDPLEICATGVVSLVAAGGTNVHNACSGLKIQLVQTNLGAVSISSIGMIELVEGAIVEGIGGIDLAAETDVKFASTSRVLSAGPINVRAGRGANDGAPGAQVIIDGDIQALRLDVFGGAGNDSMVLRHRTSRGITRAFGGAGDDSIDSSALLDAVELDGQSGNDLIVIGDPVLAKVNGSTGLDTLRLSGAGLSLDLTRLPANKLRGLESIDITGSGNNTLTLDQRSVIDLSDESNTLIVLRNAGDRVNLGAGWRQLGNETIGGILFNVYRQGDATVKVQVVGHLVVGRHIFYNNSSFDGNTAQASESDDAAIAVTKVALLSGAATQANYTNYSRGINGIMVDILDLPNRALTAEDFQFRVGNTNTPSSWSAAPIPSSIVVRPDSGVDGSSRVTIIWPDNLIQKQWLQVTVKANSNTGLQTPDVFYFGNAIGDTADSTTNAIVNATDISGIVTHQNSFLNPASIDSPYDLNHDRLVNATDVSLAVANQTSFVTALRLINVENLTLGRSSSRGFDMSIGDSSNDKQEKGSPTTRKLINNNFNNQVDEVMSGGAWEEDILSYL